MTVERGFLVSPIPRTIMALVIAGLACPALGAKTDPEKEKRFRTVAGAMAWIKMNLRDPDSVKWEFGGINRAGTIVCVRYRAKNGFGGFAREVFVVTPTGPSQDGRTWNKHCLDRSIEDLTYARHALE